jgi:DNA repair photolyase
MLLCNGPTLSVGNASSYNLALGSLERSDQLLRDSEISHPCPANILRAQLLDAKGYPKYCRDKDEGRVIYISSSVDVAANLRLVRETVELVKLLLAFTRWDIRLLSRSSLLPRVAASLGNAFGARRRVIYGMSIGTLDDELAAAYEARNTRVSIRLEALYHLQDAGLRTFAMVGPILPQEGYNEFAGDMADAIRVDQCEHVWAEMIRVRGKGISRTARALINVGFWNEAAHLASISGPGRDETREEHAMEAFENQTQFVPANKLRFLHYPSMKNLAWWRDRVDQGAVLLGSAAK